MSKESKALDLKERVVEFVLRIIHNSKFLVGYWIFNKTLYWICSYLGAYGTALAGLRLGRLCKERF